MNALQGSGFSLDYSYESALWSPARELNGELVVLLIEKVRRDE